MKIEEFEREHCDKCNKYLERKCDGKVIIKIDGTFACIEDDDE